MNNIESISQYIYPDDEQQQAEFVQHYRAKSALQRSLLHDLLPMLNDSQIALLVHEHTVRTAKRSIARNHRLRFLREFLYHTGLEYLIRHVKDYINTHTQNNQQNDVAADLAKEQQIGKPAKWGSRNHRLSLLAQHPFLEPTTIKKLLKTTSQIAREYKREHNRAIKSPRSNHAVELHDKNSHPLSPQP